MTVTMNGTRRSNCSLLQVPHFDSNDLRFMEKNVQKSLYLALNGLTMNMQVYTVLFNI